MKNPYAAPASGSRSAQTWPLLSFWLVILAISIVGVLSVVGRQIGVEHNNYGNFGGYAQFPLVWLGGFAIFPGYILGLLCMPRTDATCSIVAVVMSAYYSFAIFATVKWKANALRTVATLYVVSLGINVFNWIFVGFLSL